MHKNILHTKQLKQTITIHIKLNTFLNFNLKLHFLLVKAINSLMSTLTNINLQHYYYRTVAYIEHLITFNEHIESYCISSSITPPWQTLFSLSHIYNHHQTTSTINIFKSSFHVTFKIIIRQIFFFLLFKCLLLLLEFFLYSGNIILIFCAIVTNKYIFLIRSRYYFYSCACRIYTLMIFFFQKFK